MHDPTKIDYSKLLGFDMVADDAADGVDFQKATIGTRLGAKVGKRPPPLPTLDPAPMKLNFTVGDHASRRADHAGPRRKDGFWLLSQNTEGLSNRRYRH